MKIINNVKEPYKDFMNKNISRKEFIKKSAIITSGILALSLGSKNVFADLILKSNTISTLINSDILHKGDAGVRDFTLQNQDQDKDILIDINDGGTTRTAIQVHGDSGIVSMPRQSCVGAYLSSNSSISSGTGTTIVFNTEVEDTLGEYNNSNGIFTATEDGVYQINTNIVWQASVANKNYFLIIYHGGTEVLRTITYANTTFGALSQTASWCGRLESGDSLKVVGYQDSGSNRLIIASGRGYTFLSIAKIS